jgi:hypothetical protein
VACVARGAAAAGWPPVDVVETRHELFVTYDFDIVNRGWEALSDGGLMHVRIYRPNGMGPYPAVVLVPAPPDPGIVDDAERRYSGADRLMRMAESLTARGMAAVLYNPPGRGAGALASTGGDDREGFMHQDALARVVRAAHVAPFIIPDNVGLCSDGAGLGAAAGTLARNDDLGVRYLADIEGPWDNLEMTGYTWTQVTPESAEKHVERASLYYQHWPTSRDTDPDNEDWWAQREPRTHAAAMHVQFYQRVQFERDRAQPPGYTAHAMRMYETVRGAGIHARINGAPWDLPLPPNRAIPLLPGSFDDNAAAVLDILAALADMSALKAAAPKNLPQVPNK